MSTWVGKRFSGGAVAVSIALAGTALSGWTAPAAQAAGFGGDIAFLFGTSAPDGTAGYVVDVVNADGTAFRNTAIVAGSFPQEIALSPDGLRVATELGDAVHVTSALGVGPVETVAGCPCRGDMRWSGSGTLLLGGNDGDRVIDVGTHSASALPGNSAAPVLALSPDLALNASVDPTSGTLTVKSIATGRVSYRTAFPTGTLDPRLSAAANVAWSPDGATLAVSLTESDSDGQPVQKFVFVNAANGATIGTVAGVCGLSEQSDFSWDPAGASVLEGCDDGTKDRITIAGAVTTATKFSSLPFVSAGGGPLPSLGGPAAAVVKASAQATAPGQVTISATLPAADTAGAEVTGPHGADYGRLLGSKLVLNGLAPSKSYAFTVTPKAWDGSSGPHSVVTVKTEKAVGTVTTVSAPSSAVFGSKVRVQVKVTRGDNGHGVAKRPVTLRRSVLGGRFTTVGHGVTNSAGVVTFALAQRDDSTFTASETGSPTVGASSSSAEQVLAQIHLAATVGARAGGKRLITAHLDPARLAHGFNVEPDAKFTYVISTCLPTRGKSASTISCSLPVGKKYRLVPLGPVFQFGNYEPDGPALIVSVPS